MEELGIAPGRCVVGWDAVEDAGRFIAEYGHRALILGGKASLAAVSRRLTRSLKNRVIDYSVLTFGGECSDDAVTRSLPLWQRGMSS